MSGHESPPSHRLHLDRHPVIVRIVLIAIRIVCKHRTIVVSAGVAPAYASCLLSGCADGHLTGVAADVRGDPLLKVSVEGAGRVEAVIAGGIAEEEGELTRMGVGVLVELLRNLIRIELWRRKKVSANAGLLTRIQDP